MRSNERAILNERGRCQTLLCYVAKDVAKLLQDVAKHIAKPMISEIAWQHDLAALNTEQAFSAVFRLSLSVYGRNLVSWYERGLLNPPIANGPW